MAAKIDALHQSLRRDLFAPIAFTLGLKLEQTSWDEIAEDPSFAAFVVQSTRRLFKSDAVFTWFDGWLEAEAAGMAPKRDAQGRVATAPKPPANLPDAAAFAKSAPIARVLDLTKRLCEETRSEAAVIGYLTGPTTLTTRLAGGAATGRKGSAKPAALDPEAVRRVAALSIALARQYGELGVSALVLAEEVPVAGAEAIRPYDALVNAAEYYGIPTYLLCRHAIDAVERDGLSKLGFRAVAAPSGSDPKLQVIDDGALRDPSGASAWLAARPGARGSRLFMTGWDIEPDVSPEAVMGWQKAIAGA